MHNIIKLFFFLCSVFMYSQNLIVKYRFIKENNPIADYELNINKNRSLFFDSNYCLNDLAAKSELVILKDKPSEVKLLDKVDEVSVSTIKFNQLNWTITKEKKTIGGYNCQQAITIYKDKKWIAWFTQVLPFQDGPFIFNGLPGLILTIENDQYKFDLLSINKTSDTDCFSIINTERKEISYEKYHSLFTNIGNKNDNLLNSLNNLNLKLETNLNSINEKEKKINIIREIL